MRGPIRSTLLAVFAICGLLAVWASQASAAKLQEGTTNSLLAVYGSPPTTVPTGGGLARNFGFGANLLFQATTTSPEAALEITLSGVVAKSEDAFIGGTLQSNTTGANNPLGVAIQFVDFQKSTVGGTATQSFTGTYDRNWITDICAPGAEECRVDPLLKVKKAGGGEGEGRNIKIEDVAFNLGPGTVVQGTVWGKFSNGTTTTPACITLENPPAAAAGDQTLIVTQSSTFAVGTKVSAVAGKACLLSANNYGGEIKIANE